jgi:hypothetical protein
MPVLFAQLARRRRGERLAGFLAPGHRLPVAGRVGALDQQHAQVRRVDDDQRRDRDLVWQGYETNTQKGLCRSRQ